MGVVSEYRRNILRVRGVPDDLIDYSFADVSRYVEFDQRDWDAFTNAHTHPRPWYRKFVNQSGGLIINRWSITGDRLPSYVRFDVPLLIPQCTYFWCPDHPGRPCRFRTPPALKENGKPNGTKYVYAPTGAYSDRDAKRIDVHPIVRQQLLAREEIPEIYWCLEGVINADALAARGVAAFSVPSVTMWKLTDKHLKTYLEILKKTPRVYIIPDSDYLQLPRNPDQDRPEFVNPRVRVQGDKAYVWLRDHGVQAWFLVPPYLSAKQARRLGIEADSRLKLGIGDHLAYGGNLERWDSKTNPQGVHMWPRMAPPKLYLPPLLNRKDRLNRERDEQFLRYLLEHYGQVGFYSPGEVAAALGWSEDMTLRSKDRCFARRALTVWDGHAHASDMQYYNDRHLFRYEITPEHSKQDAA